MISQYNSIIKFRIKKRSYYNGKTDILKFLFFLHVLYLVFDSFFISFLCVNQKSKIIRINTQFLT